MTTLSYPTYTIFEAPQGYWQWSATGEAGGEMGRADSEDEARRKAQDALTRLKGPVGA